MEFIGGINEPELGSLSMEVLDYVERISNIFDQVDSQIELLPEFYKGESNNELINYYNIFRLI